MGSGDILLGWPWDRQASHPGGSSNALSCFIPQKLEQALPLWASLAHVLLYQPYYTKIISYNIHFDGAEFSWQELECILVIEPQPFDCWFFIAHLTPVLDSSSTYLPVLWMYLMHCSLTTKQNGMSWSGVQVILAFEGVLMLLSFFYYHVRNVMTKE